MRSWSSPAEGHEGDTTPTLFEMDAAPTSVDPVTELRRVEREYRRLQAEDAADQREINEYGDDASLVCEPAEEWHPSDPTLCPWCRQEARAPKIKELEEALPGIHAKALEAVRRAKL